MASLIGAGQHGDKLTGRYWLVVLSVAVAVRAVVAVGLLRAMPLVSDALCYSQMAERLLKSFPGEQAYYWPPGTAYFLLLFYRIFGASVVVARAATIAVSVASVAAITLGCERALGRPRAAWWVGWIAALYPPSIMMCGQPSSQHLVTLCLIVAAAALIAGWRRRRFGWWAVAGAALGLASLTRPSTLLMAPILIVAAGALALRRSQSGSRGAMLAAAAAGVACLAAVVGPVVLHNASHDAGPAISINNERNFFIGNNRYTPDYKTSHLAQRKSEKLDPQTRDYILRHTEKFDRPTRRAMVNEALGYIRHHKLRTLYRSLNRIRAFWGFDYLASRQVQLHYKLGMEKLGLLLLGEAGGYAALMLLVLAGLTCTWGYFSPAGRWTLLLMVLAYQLPYALAFSCGTYHFPVVWLLMPLAGGAMARLRDDTDQFLPLIRRRRVFWIAAAVFALIQIEYAYHLVVFV